MVLLSLIVANKVNRRRKRRLVLEITKKTEEIQFGKKARRNDFVSMNVLKSQSKWRKRCTVERMRKRCLGRRSSDCKELLMMYLCE